MLKAHDFGNAFSGATVLSYVFLFLLNKLSPPFFELFINSQFLGADISSQIEDINFINFLGSLIAVGIFSWMFGFLVATIYNKSSKSS